MRSAEEINGNEFVWLAYQLQKQSNFVAVARQFKIVEFECHFILRIASLDAAFSQRAGLQVSLVFRKSAFQKEGGSHGQAAHAENFYRSRRDGKPFCGSAIVSGAAHKCEPPDGPTRAPFRFYAR
ncbi:hypothetical protein D9M72_598990 [compost metagenome]